MYHDCIGYFYILNYMSLCVYNYNVLNYYRKYIVLFIPSSLICFWSSFCFADEKGNDDDDDDDDDYHAFVVPYPLEVIDDD